MVEQCRARSAPVPGGIDVRSGTSTVRSHSLHVGSVSLERDNKDFSVTENRFFQSRFLQNCFPSNLKLKTADDIFLPPAAKGASSTLTSFLTRTIALTGEMRVSFLVLRATRQRHSSTTSSPIHLRVRTINQLVNLLARHSPVNSD